MAIELVDFRIKNCDFPVRKLLVSQRVLDWVLHSLRLAPENAENLGLQYQSQIGGQSTLPFARQSTTQVFHFAHLGPKNMKSNIHENEAPKKMVSKIYEKIVVAFHLFSVSLRNLQGTPLHHRSRG